MFVQVVITENQVQMRTYAFPFPKEWLVFYTEF